MLRITRSKWNDWELVCCSSRSPSHRARSRWTAEDRAARCAQGAVSGARPSQGSSARRLGGCQGPGSHGCVRGAAFRGSTPRPAVGRTRTRRPLRLRLGPGAVQAGPEAPETASVPSFFLRMVVLGPQAPGARGGQLRLPLTVSSDETGTRPCSGPTWLAGCPEVRPPGRRAPSGTLLTRLSCFCHLPTKLRGDQPRKLRGSVRPELQVSR